jgi:hypothetical protein
MLYALLAIEQGLDVLHGREQKHQNTPDHSRHEHYFQRPHRKGNYHGMAPIRVIWHLITGL